MGKRKKEAMDHSLNHDKYSAKENDGLYSTRILSLDEARATQLPPTIERSTARCQQEPPKRKAEFRKNTRQILQPSSLANVLINEISMPNPRSGRNYKDNEVLISSRKPKPQTERNNAGDEELKSTRNLQQHTEERNKEKHLEDSSRMPGPQIGRNKKEKEVLRYSRTLQSHTEEINKEKHIEDYSRYLLRVIIKDDCDELKITLFDKEASFWLGKKASQLECIYRQENGKAKLEEYLSSKMQNKYTFIISHDKAKNCDQERFGIPIYDIFPLEQEKLAELDHPNEV